MKVRAIRVIRSAHLDACIHKAGEVGELMRKMKRFDSEIYLIRWQDGSECIVVPSDVEILHDKALQVRAIMDRKASSLDALTVMPELATEAASSSCSQPVPATRGMTGQEPAGTLPLFKSICACVIDAMPFSDCRSWYHPDYDLGGEG